jgi:hypothetical protein
LDEIGGWNNKNTAMTDGHIVSNAREWFINDVEAGAAYTPNYGTVGVVPRFNQDLSVTMHITDELDDIKFVKKLMHIHRTEMYG